MTSTATLLQIENEDPWSFGSIAGCGGEFFKFSAFIGELKAGEVLGGMLARLLLSDEEPPHIREREPKSSPTIREDNMTLLEKKNKKNEQNNKVPLLMQSVEKPSLPMKNLFSAKSKEKQKQRDFFLGSPAESDKILQKALEESEHMAKITKMVSSSGSSSYQGPDGYDTTSSSSSASSSSSSIDDHQKIGDPFHAAEADPFGIATDPAVKIATVKMQLEKMGGKWIFSPNLSPMGVPFFLPRGVQDGSFQKYKDIYEKNVVNHRVERCFGEQMGEE